MAKCTVAIASSTVTPCAAIRSQIEARVDEVAARDALGDDGRVPGTFRRSVSTFWATCPTIATSGPFTLIPTGVWIPVSCIITRVLIGCVQLLT